VYGIRYKLGIMNLKCILLKYTPFVQMENGCVHGKRIRDRLKRMIDNKRYIRNYKDASYRYRLLDLVGYR
jgi:hypothetical protein